MSDQMIYYFDSFSILVVNKESKIRRLYTPFEVLCIESVDDIKLGGIYDVDEVFPDEDDILLYKIKGNLYAYKHFSI